MAKGELFEERLTRSVIGAFFVVYRELGFGFLEHIYVVALERELRARGHRVARQIGVPVMFRGEEIAFQRLDMIVDERLIVEVKATFELHRAATRQVQNYLRATNLELALLLHFGPEPSFYRLLCRDVKRRPRRAGTPPPAADVPAITGSALPDPGRGGANA